MSDRTSHGRSPFHAGEQQVQERLGVRERMEAFARQVVRDHMPDQYRDFFEMLPFVLVGTVDDEGRPWASLLAGQPGFISTPDARTLRIEAQPLPGDPLHRSLKTGTHVGVLGIELAARRRNRLTGQIAAVDASGFTVAIHQTFGNCPQYIQARSVARQPEHDADMADRPIHSSAAIDGRARAIIEQADTLFIATAYAAEPDQWSQGADVSHRGGKPGFVKVESDRSFVFPDFSGNNHFNTVGNIVLNPRAGFFFTDFATGDMLYLTGAAEIVWDGDEVREFAGAERLIRVRCEEVIRVERSLPLDFDFVDYSPMLDHTGSWTQTEEAIEAAKERNVYASFEVAEIRPESDSITSFYLRRADGKAPARHEAGQFLPIRLAIPGQEAPVRRAYTLSEAPGTDLYRLSIKRDARDGLVSNFFHGQVKPGDRLEAMAPRGGFTLDRSTNRPVVLISAGVGITPMIAMTNFLINEGLRTRNFRRTYFIHGTRNGRDHAFAGHIRELARKHESLSAHIRYSQPEGEDRPGVSHDSTGHVDIALLKHMLPFDDYDFYLCGPAPFMQSLYDGLKELGVSDARIHYESFGPATVLKRDADQEPGGASAETAGGPVQVCFSNADVEAEWAPGKGTLLDLAESAGLSPAFSCRSGICGTCATRLKCGHVDYLEEPIAPHGDDEVLICCSTPRKTSGKESCGKDHGVVLEL